jgi:hypothetical protein
MGCLGVQLGLDVITLHKLQSSSYIISLKQKDIKRDFQKQRDEGGARTMAGNPSRGTPKLPSHLMIRVRLAYSPPTLAATHRIIEGLKCYSLAKRKEAKKDFAGAAADPRRHVSTWF